MTPEEAVEKLDAIEGDNVEDAHVQTENVLRQLLASIAPEVIEAYNRVRERTGDWWYA